jgi:hypothetical protein
MDEPGKRGELIGQALRELAIEIEDRARSGKRVRGDAAEDHVEGVRSVFERRHYAEVSAATSDRPEQLRVVVVTGGDDATIREDDFGRFEVVDCHPVLAHEPANASSECEPGDPRRGDDSTGRGQAVHAGGAVVLVPRHASLRTHTPSRGIDMCAAHRREVDHEPTVGCREPCDVVTTAAHRDLDTRLTTELHSISNVRRVRTARDECRAFVDQTVVNAPG